MRNIVTSENKPEYDEAYLSRTKRQYGQDLEKAEKASSKAKDAESHFQAMQEHKRASVYATPPENVEKHLEQAKFHAAQHRQLTRAETDRDNKIRTENAAKANTRFLKAKGAMASTDTEKKMGFRNS